MLDTNIGGAPSRCASSYKPDVPTSSGAGQLVGPPPGLCPVVSNFAEHLVPIFVGPNTGAGHRIEPLLLESLLGDRKLCVRRFWLAGCEPYDKESGCKKRCDGSTHERVCPFETVRVTSHYAARLCQVEWCPNPDLTGNVYCVEVLSMEEPPEQAWCRRRESNSLSFKQRIYSPPRLSNVGAAAWSSYDIEPRSRRPMREDPRHAAQTAGDLPTTQGSRVCCRPAHRSCGGRSLRVRVSCPTSSPSSNPLEALHAHQNTSSRRLEPVTGSHRQCAPVPSWDRPA